MMKALFVHVVLNLTRSPHRPVHLTVQGLMVSSYEYHESRMSHRES